MLHPSPEPIKTLVLYRPSLETVVVPSSLFPKAPIVPPFFSLSPGGAAAGRSGPSSPVSSEDIIIEGVGDRLGSPRPMNEELRGLSDSEVLGHAVHYFTEAIKHLDEAFARSSAQLSRDVPLEQRAAILQRKLARSTVDREGLQRDLDALAREKWVLERKLSKTEDDLALARVVADRVEAVEKEVDVLKAVVVVKELELGGLRRSLEVADNFGLEMSEQRNRACVLVAELIKHLEVHRVRRLWLENELGAVREDVAWFLRDGLSSTFSHIMCSPEFAEACNVVQRLVKEFGLHKGCVDTRNRFLPQLPLEQLPHQFPHARSEAAAAFEGFTRRSFKLLEDLKTGATSLSALRSAVGKELGGTSRTG